MSNLLILQPLTLASVAASRGTGAANLQTRSPREVWSDSTSGSPATIIIDLGAVVPVDTVFLGYIDPPHADARWQITGGAVTANDIVLQSDTALRVPDSEGQFARSSHAFWHGPAVSIRHLALTLTQPAAALPLTAGIALVGRAFVSAFGQEWGAGRRPVDTGVITSLPDGGFASVEGVRKRHFGWTFGDLTLSETDALESIAMELGETKPGLVVEDHARTAGLRARIHYGVFERWRAYERRNLKQTRWEIGIEEWA